MKKCKKRTNEEEQEVLYPAITLENLDTSKVDKSNLSSDGFCDCLRIPLIPSENESMLYEMDFCNLVDKVVYNFNDVEDQPKNLFILVDDNEGNRQYYIGADVQIDDWDGITTETVIEEINPTIEEQAIIELALIKITNYDQYLLKYNRFRMAQLPEIMNRFGFYNDCIDSQGSYRSTWVTEDKKFCMLAYVEDVKNENSKVNLLEVG